MSYIVGAFLATFLLKNQKQRIILSAIFILPCAALALLFAENGDENAQYSPLILVCLQLSSAILQVLVIKLTVDNSNRPEFFVGMFYFLVTFSIVLILNFYT